MRDMATDWRRTSMAYRMQADTRSVSDRQGSFAPGNRGIATTGGDPPAQKTGVRLGTTIMAGL